MNNKKTVKRRMKEAWTETVRRCTNPNHPQYSYYGGRGIGICDRWLDFENYYEDMGPRPEGLTLDRIDNEKGYSKENCRWASRAVQSANRRVALVMEHEGKRQTIREWAKETGIDYYTLKYRFRSGYSPKDVLGKPVKCGGLLPGRVYKKRRPPRMENIRKGEDCTNAKLNNQDVKIIRERYSKGEGSYSQLAREYGVCFQSIACAVKRKTYKHI